jgi:hypothetical protein
MLYVLPARCVRKGFFHFGFGQKKSFMRTRKKQSLSLSKKNFAYLLWESWDGGRGLIPATLGITTARISALIESAGHGDEKAGEIFTHLFHLGPIIAPVASITRCLPTGTRCLFICHQIGLRGVVIQALGDSPNRSHDFTPRD